MEPTGTTDQVVDALGRWWSAEDDEPLVVATSGSTGAPKRVRLSRAAVRASVAASARRVGGTGRWLLALPPSYVAGVQVVCRSLAAGHPPLVVEEHGSLAATVAAAGEPGSRPELFVSLVPTQLRRALADPAETGALREVHTVLVGGGPVGDRLREQARAAGVRTIATYGSAETAGGCVYDGHPLDGVAVAIEVDGRIRIGGPTLFDGYGDSEGNPVDSADALVDGWFRTSDAGRLDEDGLLQVLGRVDDMVVSGGVNVPAPAVAARLREHPGVEAVEVLGVPDEEWGNKVVAFVVGDLDLDRARAWVGEAHPRSWAPRELIGLPEIPMLANGKPDRLRLRELA